MYFLEHYHENPEFLNNYLKYYYIIEFSAKTSVDEVYFDLRSFFRYITLIKNNETIYDLEMIQNTKIDNIKCLNSIVIILSIAVITMSTLTLNEWAKETIKRKDYYNYCEPFFGSVVLNEQKNNINNITEYINNKSSEGVRIIIFSAKAALYMIPLKESNGYYDLPFYGNFGNLTEMEIIEEFKNKENVEILLQKDEENMEWQESKQINRNLKKELKKVGEIEEFEIYVNN